MKFPIDYKGYDNKNHICEAYEQAAIKYGMEHGILIEVRYRYDDSYTHDKYSLTGVYFYVNNHEFEGLKDLRTALRNKAFM